MKDGGVGRGSRRRPCHLKSVRIDTTPLGIRAPAGRRHIRTSLERRREQPVASQSQGRRGRAGVWRAAVVVVVVMEETMGVR